MSVQCPLPIFWGSLSAFTQQLAGKLVVGVGTRRETFFEQTELLAVEKGKTGAIVLLDS
jgi:hypothetical protein